MNAYAYCLGDPVNRYDPNGHISLLWRMVKTNLSQIVQLNKSPVTSPLKSIGNDALTVASTKTTVSKSISRLSSDPVGPPPRYTVEPSATPFSGKLQRDSLALPPTYESLSAGSYSVEKFYDYPPKFFGDVNPAPPPSRIQTRINNLTREYQSILDSIQDTPSPSERLRLQYLDTFIRQLRSGDSTAPIALPRYQK